MKLLGLNSPEIFIILVILLSILGPKRIEKGFLLFKKLLKFLLSKEETIKAEVKSDEPEESEVKEEDARRKRAQAEQLVPGINDETKRPRGRPKKGAPASPLKEASDA